MGIEVPQTPQHGRAQASRVFFHVGVTRYRRAHGFAASTSIIILAAQMSLEETLIAVWRQALVENASAVELDGNRYPVRCPPKRGLRQVDFVLDGNEIRGLEQNPNTKSRWAQTARSGKKVMQFLTEGRYVANVVDGKVTVYGKRAARIADFCGSRHH